MATLGADDVPNAADFAILDGWVLAVRQANQAIRQRASDLRENAVEVRKEARRMRDCSVLACAHAREILATTPRP